MNFFRHLPLRWIVARFLLVRFAGIFLFTLFALTSLLVLFDLLAHTDELALHHEDTFVPMLYYAGLRLPVLLAMIMPLSVLLAALVTFERLATQFEFVALQAAGISLRQVCFIMLLGGFAISAGHYGILVNVATPAEARLFRWAERDYEGLPKGSALEPGPAWFSAGRFRVHAANARDGGRRLDEVVLIENEQPGVIVAYYEAKEARYDLSSGWTLLDGWKQPTQGGARLDFARLDIRLPLEPAQVAVVRLPLSSIDRTTLKVLRRISAEAQSQPAPQFQAWMDRRRAEPLGALVMILFAAPLGLQLKRSGRQLRWGGLGFGVGFIFFITERIMLALGESGTVSPTLAVWGPLAVFGVVGIILVNRLAK